MMSWWVHRVVQKPISIWGMHSHKGQRCCTQMHTQIYKALDLVVLMLLMLEIPMGIICPEVAIGGSFVYSSDAAWVGVYNGADVNAGGAIGYSDALYH